MTHSTIRENCDTLLTELKIGPVRLRSCYSCYGKRALLGRKGENALRFNVSHSHGLALYAVARGREIGIDIERVHPNMAHGQIAKRFFSP